MQKDPHIARAFDRDLEAVQALVLKMGGMVEDALLNAADSALRALFVAPRASRSDVSLLDREQAFGYTLEDTRTLMAPMATTGQISWPSPGRTHVRQRAIPNVP